MAVHALMNRRSPSPMIAAAPATPSAVFTQYAGTDDGPAARSVPRRQRDRHQAHQRNREPHADGHHERRGNTHQIDPLAESE